jgi:hypothetical protein
MGRAWAFLYVDGLARMQPVLQEAGGVKFPTSRPPGGAYRRPGSEKSVSGLGSLFPSRNPGA